MEIYCIIWLFFLKVKIIDFRIFIDDAWADVVFVFSLITSLKSFIQDHSMADILALLHDPAVGTRMPIP
jgi:hypothetical protein